MEEKYFDKAMQFAIEAHKGQKRKVTGTPYILHPMEVAAICAAMSDNDALLSAALLHDTVEDTAVTIEDIEEQFSPRIAELVKCETEDKREGQEKAATWKLRKEESLLWLRDSGDLDVKKLWLADKLSNMRSFLRTYLVDGLDMWKRFNQTDTELQKWYYCCVADYTRELENEVPWQEYVYLLERVFGETYE